MRDSHKTIWGPETNLALDLFRDKPIFFYHLLRKPNGKSAGKYDWRRAGTLDEGKFDVRANGLYAEGELDDSEEGDAFRALIDANVAAWSGGFWPPTMVVREADGFMESAALVEGSGLHYEHASAVRGTTTVSYVRGLVSPDGVEIDDELPIRRGVWVMPAPNVPEVPIPVVAAPVVVAGEEVSALRAEIAGLRTDIQQIQQQPTRALSGGGGLEFPREPQWQVGSKFDDVTLGAMIYWDHAQRVISQAKMMTYARTEEFMRAMVDKMAVIYKNQREEQEKDPFRVPLRCIDVAAYHSWHQKVPHLRASEAMTSVLAGSGDELVPTLLNSVFEYYFRLKSVVLNALEVVRMPSNPWEYPTVTAGTTTRRIPEATDASHLDLSSNIFPKSKPTTAKKVFSAGKIGAMSIFSDELFQDAGLNVADMLMQVFLEDAAHDIDYVLLNADESGDATNISHYGVDPTSTAYDKILIVDGLRHFAFDDHSALGTAIDRGDVLAAGTHLTGLRKMGVRGVMGMDTDNLVTFWDPDAYNDLRGLAEFRTYEKFGPGASIVTGQVSIFDGVPVVPCEDLEAADGSGHVLSTHDSSGNGAFLTVHRKKVKVGMLRSVEIESSKPPHTGLYATSWALRMDLQKFQAGAVSYTYDIG